MVKASGKTSRSRRIRPLNAPSVIRVTEGSNSEPRAIVMERSELQITRIEDRWRVDDEWWRGRPVSRLYFHVFLEDERHATVFHDLIDDRWYEQRYA